MMDPDADQFELWRFIEAQDGVFEQACSELRAGRKQSHWMWFIFPQISGLGSSPMAVRYAIRSAAEAKAYLAHPVLGARLRESTGILLGLPGRPDVSRVFGTPDDMKFHSSMTLFALTEPAGDEEGVFAQALQRYFNGRLDDATLVQLQSSVRRGFR
jgi:uncharacterized protein (DUF1810 family)